MMSDSTDRQGARAAARDQEIDVGPDARGAGPTRTLSSAEVLGDAQEVVIDHEGQAYRLRRTSQGKLILTK